MNDFKWYFIFMAVVMLGMFAFFAYDQYSQDKRMQACVSAGMEWIRDYGDYYECRNN